MPKPRSAAAPARRPIVRREDYRPPDWLVPEIALDFALDPERTRVRARLTVARNGDHRAPLRLDGEGLKLLSVTVDGKAAAHKSDREGLTIRVAGDRAVVETLVEIAPRGSGQTGLFELGGLLCTQCEAEGFRRITFFPDRPDVLAVFSMRMSADKALYPVLLSNGNPAGGGELGDGRHWAAWHDPFPKPCYLFALVAGDLAANRDAFVTMSGRKVDLGIWVRRSDLARTAHAMASLKAAMAWDERTYGREYDLAVFNVVALADFAFGGMENKGLNIFQSAMVLLDPETATDAERDSVAALVAHEYLHNWSGNRVVCRDWFQLPLKEGFTVFRDQQFSADQGSAAVKRIEDVRALRAAQFTEDAGPRAHPVRPDAYAEVADFYTATVYVKAAEIVRMLHTVVGPEAFRAGADLYFARHDGKAAVCEDLIAAMSEASGIDLAGFRHWYARAGTPRVNAELGYDAARQRAVLTLTQDGASEASLPIPLRTALFGATSGAKLAERLALLETARGEFVFEGVSERPILSINRGFSAPVLIDARCDTSDLAFLAAGDDDPFARCEAMEHLMLSVLAETRDGGTPAIEPLVDPMRTTLTDIALDPGLIAEIVLPPAEAAIGDRGGAVDPGAIHAASTRLRAALGEALAAEWRAALTRAPADKGARRLRGIALAYLLAGRVADAGAIALGLYRDAGTMTERQAALRALADSDAPERIEALADFHRRYRGDAALIDVWFAVQAQSRRDDAIETVPRLIAHPDFTVSRPTRLGALVGGFAANRHAFHDPSGRGYRFLADVVLALDRLDPAAAARMARPLADWRRLEPDLAAKMQAELARIAAAPNPSVILADQAAAGLH